MSIATVILSIAIIPEIIAFFTSNQNYRKTQYHCFLYMSITWFFLGLGNILIAIGYYTFDLMIYKLGIIFSIPLAYSIMFLVDSISRSQIDYRKLFIITLIASALVIFSMDPDAVELNISGLGETTLALRGNFMVAGSLTFVFSGILWVYSMGKIFYYAPQTLKKIARINFIGGIFAGPGSILAFATGFVWFFPGMDYLLISIGALFSSYAFKKQTKLGFVLPFQVYRVMLIDQESSILLLSHSWKDLGFIDPSLFSGAINGISTILYESLNNWEIKDITFNRGVLLLKRSKKIPVNFVLISSVANPLLHNSLNSMMLAFEHEYKEYFKDNKTRYNTGLFEPFSDKIEEYFPYAISYK